MKLLRVERGVLQIDLANRAGIDRSRMSLIENGHVQASAAERQRICVVLGLAQDALDDATAPLAGGSR